jgi:hypothetical protein
MYSQRVGTVQRRGEQAASADMYMTAHHADVTHTVTHPITQSHTLTQHDVHLAWLQAETALARAVKLLPTSDAAWTELGECFWKKGDLTASERYGGTTWH